MKRTLTFGDYNPVHDGHVLGFQSCLQHTDRLDVYVGRKPKAHQLPREIRTQAVETALAAAGIQDRTKLVDSNSLLDIEPGVYDALMMGSDVANHLTGPSRFKDFERKFFGSFGHFVVVQRNMSPLTEEGSQAMRELGGLTILESISATSASSLRQTWIDGLDIKDALHKGVWEVIEPHISVWKLQRSS